MGKKLGICVTTKNAMTHVVGVAEAAKEMGIDVDVFLSGEGVHLTQDPRFPRLLAAGRVGVCEVSYLASGYKKVHLPALRDKDFVTQLRNAEMVGTCDRYLVF
jgi:hypothetical protein